MTRALRIAHRALVGVGLAVAGVSFAAAMTPLPEELRRERTAHDSVRVLDREGRLLREVRADDSARAIDASREELGEVAVRALVAAEDRRYFGHTGVDPISVARATYVDVARGRIVSGASTITMQLARLVRPHRRDLLGKLGEALLALRIEASLDKDRIVTEYANRAPFGPGVRGLRAASRFYFDKEPVGLSIGEAALLASLPKGPAAYDPHRYPARVEARRALVLDRMSSFGLVEDEAKRVAAAEPTAALRARAGRSAVAAHYVSALLAGRIDGRVPAREGGTVRSTLDAALQAEAEHAVAAQVRALGDRHVTAGAALVIDNASGDVLAYVGSPDPFDHARDGFNDGVRARRQAGSTLKPFLYGLAFDRGELDAASTLADVPLTLPVVGGGGAFVPANYDGKFHGPVRARVALASSLNVPAVALAERVGAGEFLSTLRRVGFALEQGPEHYGAALALGVGEVSLLELVRAYALLARGGDQVLSPSASWLVADILADKEARLPAFGEQNVLELPFRAAVKTGTSKGFRDNWAVGFTSRITAGVWVGNFDGSPMQGVSGVAGAGPMLRAVLLAADRRAPSGERGPRAPAPALGFEAIAVCPLSGGAPTAACPHAVHEWVARDHARDRKPCTMHVHAMVERATGAVASPRCVGRAIERRVFEDMPPELMGWARSAHRPLFPETVSTVCAPGTAAGEPALGEESVRIEHPAHAARYYLEPGRPASHQSIGVRVRAPRRASWIALRVDGREVSRARPGEPLAWTPLLGRHALVAEAAGTTSEPVTVVVE